MRENGMRALIKEMEGDTKFGQMGHCMRDTGKMIKPMEEED